MLFKDGFAVFFHFLPLPFQSFIQCWLWEGGSVSMNAALGVGEAAENNGWQRENFQPLLGSVHEFQGQAALFFPLIFYKHFRHGALQRSMFSTCWGFYCVKLLFVNLCRVSHRFRKLFSFNWTKSKCNAPVGVQAIYLGEHSGSSKRREWKLAASAAARLEGKIFL